MISVISWCLFPLITRGRYVHAARRRSPQRARRRYPFATVSCGRVNALGGTKEEKFDRLPVM